MNKRADPSLAFDTVAAQCRTTEAVSATRRKVLVLGLFPPPIDGQRVVTQRMFDEISAATTALRRDLDRFPALGRFSKLVSALSAALLVPWARLRGFSAVYLAPHSGAGLLFSCLLAGTSRLCGFELFVHYHSYRNIARYSRLMAAFVAVCGRGAVHIVLAPPMEWGLRRHYKVVRRVMVVSNSVFVSPATLHRDFEGRRIRIGHLSNLSREKGIETVLDCMRRLTARNAAVELVLGGPAKDATIEALIAGARAEFGASLRYLGPVPQDRVRRFYEEIDVFLFPTRHEHEAEPLVLIDAVSAGVPVIATDRGCIGYLLEATGGCAFEAANFVDRAVEQIAAWGEDRGALAAASEQAQRRFWDLHVASRLHLNGLISRILTRSP